MSDMPKARVMLTADGTQGRVYVGNWAFPHMELGYHAPTKAKKIAAMWNKGEMEKAIEMAGAT